MWRMLQHLLMPEEPAVATIGAQSWDISDKPTSTYGIEETNEP